MFDSPKKTLLVAFLAILSLVLVFLFFFKREIFEDVFVQTIHLSSGKTENVEKKLVTPEFQFTASSELAQFNLQIEDKPGLVDFASRFGLTEKKGIGLWGTKSRIQVRRINIVLSKKELRYGQVVNGLNEVVEAYDHSLDKNGLTISIYLSPKILARNDRINRFNLALVNSLYMTAYPEKVADGTYLTDSLVVLKEFMDSKRIFVSISEIKQQGFLRDIHDWIFKPVFAACSGSYECGRLQLNCPCSNDFSDTSCNSLNVGTRCGLDTDGNGILDGRCGACTSFCVAGSPRSCIDTSDQAFCGAQAACSLGDCKVGSCSWNGAPLPPPGPTPPPPPPGCPSGKPCTQTSQCSPFGWCDSTPGVNQCSCAAEGVGPCQVTRCVNNACVNANVAIKGGCTPSAGNDCCPNDACQTNAQCIPTPPPPASPANLTISSFVINDSSAVPSGSDPNATVPATVTVVNNGGTSANGFEIAIDRRNSPSNLMNCTNGSRSVVRGNLSLAAGASMSVTLDMPTPANSGGPFWAAAMVDSRCQVVESNENDNVLRDQYSVASKANLAVTSINIPSGNAGAVVNATVGIVNNGETNASNFIVAIDKKLNSNQVMSCAQNQSSWIKSSPQSLTNVAPNNVMSLTIPVTLPVGANTFRGGVLLDSGCAVDEYSETDNFDDDNYTTTGPTFFQAFGGNVTVLKNIDNRDLPEKVTGVTQFLVMTDASSKSEAGVVTSNALTPMVYPASSPYDRISQMGKVPNTAPGWKVSPYVQVSDVGLKVSSQKLYDAVSKTAGFVDSDIVSTSGNCIDASGVGFVPKNANYRVWCYRNSGDFEFKLGKTTANATDANLVLVPASDLPVFSVAVTNAKIINNIVGKKRTITVFVNQDVTISRNIQSDGNTSGIAFVVAGNVTVDPAVSRLDGAYIFSGTLDTGNDAVTSTPLVTSGMFLGTKATDWKLQRSISDSVTAAETFKFHGKYLDLFKNVLSRPAINWTQLPGV